jgi:hypothetical protein
MWFKRGNSYVVFASIPHLHLQHFWPNFSDPDKSNSIHLGPFSHSLFVCLGVLSEQLGDFYHQWINWAQQGVM